jgi:hypothetical protein
MLWPLERSSSLSLGSRIACRRRAMNQEGLVRTISFRVFCNSLPHSVHSSACLRKDPRIVEKVSQLSSFCGTSDRFGEDRNQWSISWEKASTALRSLRAGRRTGSPNSASYRCAVRTPRPMYRAMSFHEFRMCPFGDGEAITTFLVRGWSGVFEVFMLSFAWLMIGCAGFPLSMKQNLYLSQQVAGCACG